MPSRKGIKQLSKSPPSPKTTFESEFLPSNSPTSSAQVQSSSHRKARSRAKRRQSFAATIPEHTGLPSVEASRLEEITTAATHIPSVFRIPGSAESESFPGDRLLDHRSYHLPAYRTVPNTARPELYDHDDGDAYNPTNPLLSSTSALMSKYGTADNGTSHHTRRQSNSHGLPRLGRSQTAPISGSPSSNYQSQSATYFDGLFDTNNPPSVPSSPRQSRGSSEDDHSGDDSDNSRHSDNSIDRDSSYSPNGPSPWPENGTSSDVGTSKGTRSRRRERAWPNLAALNSFCAKELRAKSRQSLDPTRSVPDMFLVDRRLKAHSPKYRRPDDSQPRFAYFNVDRTTSIKSHSLSELLQEGLTFEDLFIPKPTELVSSSSSSDNSDEDDSPELAPQPGTPIDGSSKKTLVSPSGSPSAHNSRDFNRLGRAHLNQGNIKSPVDSTGRTTPALLATHSRLSDEQNIPRERPTFWLDVLKPTGDEMEALRKAFGLHDLTVEDIRDGDTREKVEIFNHYYFINYCSFEQDRNSDRYMEPVNFYAVVFREGILTFHFSRTPHPANVRRRIRELSSHLIVSSDRISYALIDDITDAYSPLIESIKDEVEDVDADILKMHSSIERASNTQQNRRVQNERNEIPSNRYQSSWSPSGLLVRFGLRRSHSDVDLRNPGPDPERLGMGVDYHRPSTIGIPRGFSPEDEYSNLPTGIPRSGPWRRRPSRPSRPDYRNQYTATKQYEEKSDSSSVIVSQANSDASVLLKVGLCRKKVMSLYRLLGPKATVIKSFAKRCTDQISIAPHSEIGIYLSDIQDHIVTMTSNLEHYELLLSRTHSNYFALINIRVTQRAEATNDVLNKLTVLGTIVLPMNIITGMWGMNVLVPGQGAENSLTWFWSITCGLAMFGVISFLVAKRTLGIV